MLNKPFIVYEGPGESDFGNWSAEPPLRAIQGLRVTDMQDNLVTIATHTMWPCYCKDLLLVTQRVICSRGCFVLYISLHMYMCEGEYL